MGIADVLKVVPEDFVPKFVFSEDEKLRRLKALERLQFYKDQHSLATLGTISELFESDELKARYRKFAHFGGAASYFKRIIDEISGHVYSLAPARRVGRNLLQVPAPEVEEGQDPAEVAARMELPPNPHEENYNEIAEQIEPDSLLDQALRLTFASNTSIVATQYIKRLNSVVARPITPAQCSVVEDPDDCARILGYAYQAGTFSHGKKQSNVWVFWDDTITFQFTEQGPISKIEQHPLGIVPGFPIHAKRPMNCFWDETTGSDLVEMQKLVSFLYMLISILHKSQGHKQLFISGDGEGFGHGQIFGEEYPIMLGDATIQEVDMAQDANHYLGTVDATVTSVAANYGISRDRLNQKTTGVAMDSGLMERRQRAVRVARKAEKDLYRVMAAYGNRVIGKPISEKALFEVDFAEVEALGDRKHQLETWKMLVDEGYANKLDVIAALNPEAKTQAERLVEYEQNIMIREKLNDMLRRTNAPKEGGGLSPEVNGAAGPIAAREGTAVADQLLEAAKTNAGGQ